MKKIVLVMLVCVTVIGAQEYETGKIDTHGGQENYSYEKKNKPFKSVACMSDFLHKGKTKESPKSEQNLAPLENLPQK